MKIFFFFFFFSLFSSVCFASSLSNKVVLVTGASSGIGWEVSKYFAEQGAQVVLAARRLDRLEALRAEIEAAGGSAVAVACDVTDESAQARAFEAAINAFSKPVNYVFANAGYEGNTEVSFYEADLSEVRKVLEINVMGYYITLREARRHWLQHQVDDRSIVFISSILGSAPKSTYAPGVSNVCVATYSGSKYMVNQIFNFAHASLSGEGVRVFNVGPAVFASEMVDRYAGTFQMELAEMAAILNPVVPTVGDPVNIAKAVTWMWDGTSAWGPGSNIVVDNDATYSVQLHFDAYSDDLAPNKGWVAVDHTKVYDLSGKNLYFQDESKIKDEL